MVHVDQEIEAADAAYGRAELEEAERHLRAVLAFDPAEPRALHRLGHIAMKRDQPEVAADYFQQSLVAQGHAISDSSATIPTPTLAELYARQGYGDAAADIYRELLERQGEHPRASEWRERLDGLAAAGEEPGPAEAEEVAPSAETGSGAEDLPGPIPGLQEAVQALPPGWGGYTGPESDTTGDTGAGDGDEVAWARAQRLEAFLDRVARYREQRSSGPARRLEAFLERAERHQELRRLEHFLTQVDAHRGLRELERLHEHE